MNAKILAVLIGSYVMMFLGFCLHGVVFAFSFYLLTGMQVPFYLDFLGAIALGDKGRALNVRLAIVLWIATVAGLTVPLMGVVCQ